MTLTDAARQLLDLWEAGEQAGGEHDLDELDRGMEQLALALIDRYGSRCSDSTPVREAAG